MPRRIYQITTLRKDMIHASLHHCHVPHAIERCNNFYVRVTLDNEDTNILDEQENTLYNITKDMPITRVL